MKRLVILFFIFNASIYSCQEKQNEEKQELPAGKDCILPKRQKPDTLAYEVRDAKQWLLDSTITSEQREIVYAINRTDRSNFKKMDTVIVPVDLSGDLVYYLPFPLKVPYLKDIQKVVFFSYPTQTFAAYECGELVRTGPTNMGREKDPTPTGLFFTNWKARKTISTVNDEWELLWNFNILNKGGIGWHQYTMPGYPASHSCLRLNAKDAKFLYTWADQWVLADKITVQVKGTPVIVFGSYDFHSPKPWLKLVNDPHALDIPEDELKRVSEPFLDEMIREQENRQTYEAEKNGIPMILYHANKDSR